MKRIYLFISILFLNLTFTQAVLSMGDGTVNAGETVVISTNLSNILANAGADAVAITVNGAIDDITADEVTALNLITETKLDYYHCIVLVKIFF